ncbi:response regulator [Sphingobacterium daejeonense]|uniref:response regulator n=1 Tax=Sphingobacterium daejeonense TaxID=371142 RepID=UPI0010C52214|nr:response regulator [Sphingobacterium daejeonense]VTP96291.1 Hydrogenase transcriptional regulatory protein hupR1 [Sphingobacterium daejeonense]
MNSENKINVLYLDDEENNLFSFKATFRIKYNVFIASKGAEALDIIRDNEIHVIITDQRMPEMTGVEFLEEVIKIKPEPIRILLTGYTDMAAVVDAINKGKIFHYLNKPWKEEEISETVSRAFEIYEKKKNIIDQNSQLEISNEQLEFLLRQKLLS